MVKSERTSLDLTKLLRTCEVDTKRFTVIYDNKTKTYCVMDNHFHDTVIEGSKQNIEFFIKGLILGRNTVG